MTIVRKELGQSAPSATTETVLYTVPALTSTTKSSLSVCNRGATVAYFRFSNSVGGGATATKDYIYYDLLIPPNYTLMLTAGFCWSAGTVCRVYASNGNLSVNLYGEEVS